MSVQTLTFLRSSHLEPRSQPWSGGTNRETATSPLGDCRHTRSLTVGPPPWSATAKRSELSRTVADFAARDAALADARTVSASATVVDRMRVNPRMWPTDALLERNLLSALRHDPDVPLDDLTVAVRHGHVILRGVVATENQRSAAVRIIMQTRGVRLVKDEATILIQRSMAPGRNANAPWR